MQRVLKNKIFLENHVNFYSCHDKQEAVQFLDILLICLADTLVWSYFMPGGGPRTGNTSMTRDVGARGLGRERDERAKNLPLL